MVSKMKSKNDFMKLLEQSQQLNFKIHQIKVK